MRRPTCSPRPRAVVSRRTTLGLAAGGVGVLGLTLSGCDLDLDRDLGGDPEPADDSPDAALVAGLVAAIDERLAAVTAARAGTAGLRAPLRGLQELHEAHRTVLDSASDPASDVPTPTATTPTDPAGPDGPPARVLRRVRAAETRHQAALVDAAVAAQSGALARLVGSMSASVAQHLAVLPTEVAR